MFQVCYYLPMKLSAPVSVLWTPLPRGPPLSRLLVPFLLAQVPRQSLLSSNSALNLQGWDRLTPPCSVISSISLFSSRIPKRLFYLHSSGLNSPMKQSPLSLCWFSPGKLGTGAFLQAPGSVPPLVGSHHLLCLLPGPLFFRPTSDTLSVSP